MTGPPLAAREIVLMNWRTTMGKIRKLNQGKWRLHLMQVCLAITLFVAGAMVYLVLTNI
jgi:hypothetical protein